MIRHEAITKCTAYRRHMVSEASQEVLIIFISSKKVIIADGMVDDMVVGVWLEFFVAFHF